MRFWLVQRLEKSALPAITTDDPKFIASLTQQGYRCRYMPELGVAALGKKFRVKGHYNTKDRNEVLVLMKVAGPLRCNAQDAIDEGILTFDEVRALGFADVVDRKPVSEPEPEAPKVVAPKPELKNQYPDFHTMKKEALVAWADEQEPQIHLDKRKRQEVLVAEILKALEERK